MRYKPKIGYLCILFIIALSLIVGIVYAAISGTIASPTAGYYNNYAILLNVTSNDNANVTFNTSAFATLTTLYTNSAQGNVTLNTTFLNEGNNTIYIFVTNATNGSDTNTVSVANVAVDVSAPTFDEALASQTVELGSGFSYDVNATDSGIGIDSYFVNDTTNFAINASGYLSNNTDLSVGTYGLNVSVNDSFNQILSSVINVTVQDTTIPTWDEAPSAQTVEYGTAFSYDVNASDLQSITYAVNDTANFAINASGVITNNTLLSLGSYSLNINATDTSSNVNSTTITITVQDTTAPTWTQTPANQSISFGAALNYDLNASDNVNISSYFINDTGNFSINSSGMLINATSLAVGNYSLNVSANDTSNNVVSSIITITVATCAESWSCTGYSTCSAGTQTRTCTDANSCGTTADKPAESQSCSSSGGGSSGGGSVVVSRYSLEDSSKTLILRTVDKLTFKLGEETHTIQIKKIYDEYVTVVISSDPIEVDVYANQTEKVDVNHDGVFDIALTLEKIYTVSAKITFEKISEEVSERIGVESPIDDPLPPQPGETPVAPAADGAEDTSGDEKKGFGKTLFVLALIFIAALVIYIFLIKPKR